MSGPYQYPYLNSYQYQNPNQYPPYSYPNAQPNQWPGQFNNFGYGQFPNQVPPQLPKRDPPKVNRIISFLQELLGILSRLCFVFNQMNIGLMGIYELCNLIKSIVSLFKKN